MTIYKVYPSGEKALFELIFEEGSPSQNYLFSIGGRSYIYEGLPGILYGDAFFAADPNFLNVLTIRGTGRTHYQIDVPVTSIFLEEGLTLFDEDSKTKVHIDHTGFSIDVGETAVGRKQEKPVFRTPSPWQ